MAATGSGRNVTERHRLAQVGLRAQFLREFAADWSILDWARIDDTAVTWVRSMKRLIRSWRQRSADLSVDYYEQFRQLEKPDTTVPVPVIVFSGQDQRPRTTSGQVSRPTTGHTARSADRPTNDTIKINGHEYKKDANGLVKPRIDWDEFDKAVERSLLVTGPSELKRRAAKHEPEDAATRSGLVVASKSASRHVLNGGRETLLTLVQADETALGWARVTDGDPCHFCAMLASRGPVYKSRAQAGFKPHDGCACSAEPVFSRTADWPGNARDFQRLWYASTRGYSGKDAVNAFRRAYEAQRRAGLPVPLTA